MTDFKPAPVAQGRIAGLDGKLRAAITDRTGLYMPSMVDYLLYAMPPSRVKTCNYIKDEGPWLFKRPQFCGAPTCNGSPYCPEHYRLCYITRSQRVHDAGYTPRILSYT